MMPTATQLIMLWLYARRYGWVLQLSPHNADYPIIVSSELDVEACPDAGHALAYMKVHPQWGDAVPDEEDTSEWPQPYGFLAYEPAIIHFDGGCHGNGTEDSVGGWAYIDANVDASDYKQAAKVSGTTNNRMEYTALFHAIRYAIARGYRHVNFLGDSKLVVEQVNGRWKVNDPELSEWHANVCAALQNLETWTLTWIPREQNLADAVYNELWDES